MLSLLKRAALLGLAASWAPAIPARTLTVDSYAGWAAGTLTQTDAAPTYGELILASRLGIGSDRFDQPFLKDLWRVDPVSSLTYYGGGWDILSGAVNGYGIQTAPLAVDGPSNQVYVTLGPAAPIGSGALGLNGRPWGGGEFSVQLTRTSGTLAILAMLGTTEIARANSFGANIGSLAVCLSFTPGITTTSSVYYLSTFTAQWTPLTPATSTWKLLTTTTFTLSSVDYVIGLGAPPGTLTSGSAQYSNFQVRPYASQGTWLSAPLDWGGTPQRAGRIRWDASVPALTSLQIQTRSSADGRAWSDFSAPCANAAATTHPPARYVQVLATLASSDPSGNSSPVLHSLTLEQPELGGPTLLDPATVKILPNPVKSGRAQIQWLLGAPAKAVTLEFSGPGRRHLLQVAGGALAGLNTYALDCDRLANDVYFLRLRALGFDGVEVDVVKKLVVSR